MTVRHMLSSFLLVVPLAVAAQDFSGSSWGETIADIEARETNTDLTPASTADYRLYETDNGARIAYQFDASGRLNRGTLLFPEPALAPGEAVQRFQAHYSILVEQYGDPRAMQAVNDGEALTDTPGQWPGALQDGLVIQALWETPRTRIKHQLMWHNNQPWEQTVYEPLVDLPSASVSGSAGLF